MHTETNGIQTHYTLDGPADAPVVLFSHSLATHLDMWEEQRPLAGDFCLLRYDARGHGGSDAPPGPYTLAMLADDACALLDRLGIDRVHWAGISMGGMIGQTFALRHPKRCLSLALFDTLCEFPREAADVWQERIDSAERHGMSSLVAPTIERWFSPTFRESAPQRVAAVQEMIRTTPVPGYLGCSRAIMGLELGARIAAIEQPTLVVAGEDDAATPLAANQRIHETIAGSRFEVLPGARHLTTIERPDTCNDLLGAFLSAV